jgi:hypothetical protein
LYGHDDFKRWLPARCLSMSTAHAPEKLHSISSVSRTLNIPRSLATRLVMTSGVTPLIFGKSRIIGITEADLGVIRLQLVAEGIEVQS